MVPPVQSLVDCPRRHHDSDFSRVNGSVVHFLDGHLDKLPRTDVAAWEKAFLTFMRDQKSELRKKIVDTQDLELDKTTNRNPDLEAAIGEFQAQFAASKAKA